MLLLQENLQPANSSAYQYSGRLQVFRYTACFMAATHSLCPNVISTHALKEIWPAVGLSSISGFFTVHNVSTFWIAIAKLSFLWFLHLLFASQPCSKKLRQPHNSASAADTVNRIAFCSFPEHLVEAMTEFLRVLDMRRVSYLFAFHSNGRRSLQRPRSKPCLCLLIHIITYLFLCIVLPTE